MDIELYNMLKIVAPGTDLRLGLDNIISANTGALIVIGDTKDVLNIIHGGFYINCEYNSSYIYELAKMDGAIIISNDYKKILYANVQLIPSANITSNETGTRHKTAERVAKQTDALVISISQRRNIITLYKSNHKYILKDVNEILSKANQAIQTLEKYKSALDKTMENLTFLEFEDSVVLYDVMKAIQKLEMVWRISGEINMYISELGIEGRLLNMQVVELMDGVALDRINLVKDYAKSDSNNHKFIWNELSEKNSEELLNLNLTLDLLGYDKKESTLDTKVRAKGYRVLSKIPRIPQSILENVIDSFENFQDIIKASSCQLNSIRGIGETRANNIIEGLKKYKSQGSP